MELVMFNLSHIIFTFDTDV